MLSSIRKYTQEINPKLLEWLFIGPYFFYIVINCLLMTTLPLPSILAPISKLPLVLVLLKFFIDCLNNKVPRVKLLSMITLFLLSLFIWLIADQTMVLYLAILTMGAHDISAKKLLKQHVNVLGSILIVLVILSTVGIIENRVIYRDDGVTARYSFGINYPTDFAALVFYLYALKYVVSDRRCGIGFACLGIGLATFLLVFSHARLDAMVLGLLAITIVLSHYVSGFKQVEKLFIYSFILLFALTIILSFVYRPDNRFLVSINTLLSDRLSLGMQAVQNYDFKLFGQYIALNGFGDFNSNMPYHFIDSSYLQMILRFGVLYSMFYAFAYTKLVNYLYKFEHHALVIILGFFSIHAFLSHHLFNPIYNPLWLLLFADFSDFAIRQPSARKLAVVGQLGDPKTGLGKALNDFSSYADAILEENDVVEIDIIHNKSYFKHLAKLASVDVESFYFTPAGSLGGHLRDLTYLIVMALRGRRIVLHFHNSNFGNVIQRHPLLIGFNRILFKRIDRIILLGQKQRDMFEGLNIPYEKYAFIPNGIDDELFISEEIFNKKNGKRIIYFSNMIAEKGYLHVLEAAKAFKNTDYEFYFSGKFYDETAQEQFIEAIKELPNVVYINGVYGTEKKRLLERMDYFILPSEYKDETLPISMLEAMANALYIIVSPRGVIPEVLNYNTSTLLPEINASEVIDAILDAELPDNYADFEVDTLKERYNSKAILASILRVCLGNKKEDMH